MPCGYETSPAAISTWMEHAVRLQDCYHRHVHVKQAPSQSVLHIVVQGPPERVLQDIPTVLVQLSLISYHVFVVSSLPHRFAWSTTQFIDRFADCGFERPNHRGKRPAYRSAKLLVALGHLARRLRRLLEENNDGVEMIGHHQASIHLSMIEMQGQFLTAVPRNLPVGAENHPPIHHLAKQRFAPSCPNGHAVGPGLRVVVARQSKRTAAIPSGASRLRRHLPPPTAQDRIQVPS